MMLIQLGSLTLNVMNYQTESTEVAQNDYIQDKV